MKKVFLLLGILIFLIGCEKKRENNAKLPLSDEEIKEAIEYGKKNVSLTYTEFTKKWAVDLGYNKGKGRAVLITPFLRVALIGKKAAKYNEKIDYSLIKKVLSKDADKLYFDVMLFGDFPEFGRTVEARLKYNGREIFPVYLYFPPYSQISRDYTQIATGRIKFPKDDLPDNCKIILIVTFYPSKGEKVTTCKFCFDLNKLR